jgi:XTP/dITP diphosphohydrolase
MKIIFDSANKNKLAEIKALLPDHIELLGLADVGIHEEIPEPGITIKENSFLKANFVVDFLKKNRMPILPVFADDSGLEVLALNNAPGVLSAIYAGEPRDDTRNNQKLLAELKSITKRSAKFKTVITLISNAEVFYFEGGIDGTIAFELRGQNGFGYDALFIPRGYRSTFAELDAQVKNKISHRALAVNKLIEFLNKQTIV